MNWASESLTRATMTLSDKQLACHSGNSSWFNTSLLSVISGIMPSLCHLWAYDVLWCIIAPWFIGRVCTGCFTSSGCVFVLVVTAWIWAWSTSHFALVPLGRSLYRIDRQLRTVTPVPLASKRKSWLGADCLGSSYAQQGETEVGPT